MIEKGIHDIYFNEAKGLVAIQNKCSTNLVKISKEVYDIIKDANSIDELKSIASVYEDDKEYFDSLIQVFDEKGMFDRKSNEGLLSFSYAITDLCNLKCTHCCYSAGYTKEDVVNNVDVGIIRSIIKHNPKTISITGGEPLLVNNFAEVMSILKKEYDGVVILSTNATLINKTNIDEICDVFNSFDISLDGFDAKTTDKIRGEGTFERVINAIKLLRQNTSKNVAVTMAIDNKTYKYKDDFFKLCDSLGVQPRTRAMNLVGRAKINHDEDSEDIIKFWSGDISDICGCYDCPGGVNEIFVDNKGDLYPCANFREPRFMIGNIYDCNWQSKLGWNKSNSWFEAYSEYIPDTRKECSDCEVRTFCWNCPSIAKPQIEGLEDGCLKKKCSSKRSQLMEALWDEA